MKALKYLIKTYFFIILSEIFSLNLFKLIKYIIIRPIYALLIFEVIRNGIKGMHLIIVLIIWSAYRALSMISLYFPSFNDIKSFGEEFLWSGNFSLEPVPAYDEIIKSSKDFNLTNFRKKMVAEIAHKSNKVSLMLNPVRCYHVRSKSGYQFLGCKAYVYTMGVLILLHRSNSISESIFEKFLFYHEIGHINDFGHINKFDLYHAKNLVIFNTIFFLIISDNLTQVIVTFIYFLSIGFHRWVIMDGLREVLADCYSLSQFENLSEKAKLIDLLTTHFSRLLKSSKNYREKVTLRQRLYNLSFIKQDIEHSLNSNKNLSGYIPKPNAQFYNHFVGIFSVILLFFFSHSLLNSQLAYPLIVFTIVIILLRSIWIMRSRKLIFLFSEMLP